MVETKILVGSLGAPTFEFDNTSIESIVCENAVSLTGGEMTADVLETSVFFNDENGALRNIQYATSIWYLQNGQVVGQYYCKSVKRTAINRYLIQATSLIGLLENEVFYGGMYQNATFSEVLSDILYCDGVSPKYKVYNARPKTGKSGEGDAARIPNVSSSQWKYRMHVEFVLVDPKMDTPSSGITYKDTFVAGSTISDYNIVLRSYKRSNGKNYWVVTLNYNGSTLTIGDGDEAFTLGNGSRIVADIDPIGKAMTCEANYKRGDSAGVTGVIKKSEAITPPTNMSRLSICCLFGPVRENGIPVEYNVVITWETCDFYDETGTMVACAVYYKDPDPSSTYHLINCLNPVVTTDFDFEPDGDAKGELTDISKYRIMRDISRSIEFNSGVAESRVYGWIPVTTRREALHQLLFAQNVNLIKSGNGGVIFTPLANVTSGTIEDENIYMGGREEELNQAKSINVTEHSFSYANLSSQVIFDNSQSAEVVGDYIAYFKNAPIYGTPTASGGITIKKYNCNMAIVSGRGIINGTPYIHSNAAIKSTNDSVMDGNDVTVSDVSLITPLNSDNTLKRLEAYYFQKISKITNEIKYNGEKCGNVYSVKSPYADRITGFLTKIVSRSSSFTKSECEFISGYTPPKGSGYSNFIILTAGETFTLPSYVLEEDEPSIRINLIGSGENGTSGSPGEAGKSISSASEYTKGGAGGKGGKGGTGGLGGRIYSTTVTVSNVTSVSVEASGKEIVLRAKNSGGSVVNTYSSSSGVRNTDGFSNIFTGIVYAVPGKNGIDGGAGGKGGNYIEENPGIEYGEDGENVGIYSGGKSPESRVPDWSNGSHPVYANYAYDYFYGGGGGASGGNNGGDAYYSGKKRKDGGSGITMYAGKGADGGNPAEGSTTYGSGGNGGNGGGGGGGAGIWQTTEHVSPYETSWYGGMAGSGGAAGSGASGIEGCAIIYY